MLYFYLKIIHVIIACLLVSAGLGGALYLGFAHYQRNFAMAKAAYNLNAWLNVWVIVPLGGLQALLGFAIFGVQHDSIHLLWVMMVYVLFFVAAITYFISVYFQLRCKRLLSYAMQSKSRLSPAYGKAFKAWLVFGTITLCVLAIMVFYMANK